MNQVEISFRVLGKCGWKKVQCVSRRWEAVPPRLPCKCGVAWNLLLSVFGAKESLLDWDPNLKCSDCRIESPSAIPLGDLLGGHLLAETPYDFPIASPHVLPLNR